MRRLITGGTGTLGHALVHHWLTFTDDELVVYSRDELKQAHMRERFPDRRVNFFLGDVRDRERLEQAFHGVDIVVHAAALKRVDAVAGDPVEVTKTNVLGTWNVLEAARRCRVGRTLLVSSDKACEPINAYGASKFSAEQLATSFNSYSVPQGTASATVRYGNVLGSRGSVVHIWRALPSEVPLTLTVPGMTRFIITLPQALWTIDEALGRMEGGEIFVPRLKACSMEVLAEAAYPGRARTYVGRRAGGEKLHEILLTADEVERAVDPDGQDYLNIITPHVHSWRSGWHEGYACQGALRSDSAEQLTVDEVRGLLHLVPNEGI